MIILKKYIPSCWNEVIGQDEVIAVLKEYKSIKELPHLLFSGQSGIGKTACAFVLGKTLGVTVIEKNASDERGIDIIRGEIKTLLRTAGQRIILLDESDALTEPAQEALRRLAEKALVQTNNRIIFTANKKWKIIEPIISRCANFNFKPLSENSIKKIILRVLEGENAKFKNKEEIVKVLKLIAESSRGDARKALNLTELILSNRDNMLSILEREVVEVDLAKETFRYAVEGSWEKTLRSLENLLLAHQTNSEKVMEVFWSSLEKLEIPPAKKFPLYRALADTERAIKTGTNPLIQFGGFLSSIIAVTHIK